MDNEEKLVEKPLGKPIERIAGRLLKFEGTDYVEFRPTMKRETESRNIIKQSKGISYYENKGEKDNSYSLHVNVGSDCKDPASEILSRVQDTLAPLTKKEPKLPTAKFLIDKENLKVWSRKGKKELCAMITLDFSKPVPFVSSQLFALSQEINKIINSNGKK